MKELKNVVIYTKDHCPFSKRVKEYLTSEKLILNKFAWMTIPRLMMS